MASSPAPFSDDFARTAREEADRLRVRAGELQARGERWIARGQQLVQEAERLHNRVRDLDELLGNAPQLRIDLQSKTLQGQRLREEATRILLAQYGLRTPIHYRAWYGLLTDSGLEAGGKDPLATFLTQITRSPVVERVEDGGGMYQLDPQGAYERARGELAEARRALTGLEECGAGSGAEDGRDSVDLAEQRLARAQRKLDAVLEARSNLFRERLSAA